MSLEKVQAEPEANLMIARYFDSGIARFLAVDPAAESVVLAAPQSWNRYTYAANNPLRYIDPDGRHNEEGHTTITSEALDEQMSSEAIEQVTEANIGMDTLGSLADTSAEGANQHGMAGVDAEGDLQTPEEASVGISAAIDGEIATAAGLALDGDIEGARAAMGRATHTAQDQDADSHGPGQQYRGLRTPVGEIRSHMRNDRNLTGRERAAGVSATRAVHGATIAAIHSEGSARGLTDAAIAGAVERFNGR